MRLKWTGWVVLALGILSAALVYGIGSRAEGMNNDPSMLRFNDATQRQMGNLYGNSGVMMDEWTEDLKQPGTQAILILIVSGLISGGCFYFARQLALDEEPPSPQA